MKKALLIIALFLLVFSAKAQEKSYTFDKIGNTVEFDISKISLFEQRAHFLYLLNNDDRFVVTASDRDGIFVVKRNDNSYKFNLEDTFAEFFNEENKAFGKMSKDEVGELYGEWKSSLPSIFIASMMMDVYVKDRQNNLCANADPFCTDNGIYQFPAGVNAGQGEQGPNYDCLHSTPNPAWYYMRMANSGGMNIYMYSTPSEDIDFCCWGPFSDPTSPCPNGLTLAKRVSCSYSANPTENCIIPNSAQSGEYYILVITNYSNHNCNITFSKTSGSGTTDCSILEPFLTASTPCVGSSLVLEANVIEGATYNWTGPDNQTHNGRTWTRTNATLNMSGLYSCHVVAGTQSGTETINAQVLPNVTSNFTFTEAIAGDPVQFTGTETTTPAGHTSEINVRQWSFGDGTTSTAVNPTHTYSTPGDYQVSYFVAASGNGGECGDTKTKTIQIRNALNANVSSDNTSFCEDDAVPHLTATATGGYGNYTYSWTATPQCTIDYPNSASTTAHPTVGTTTFTCVISDGHSTQTKSVSVTVNAIPDVTITGPNPAHVNYGGTATLSVPELSGATYTWTSEPANLIASGQGTHQIQTSSLTVTVPVTYHVTVSKNGCSDSNSFTIAVGDALMATVTITGQQELCSGESTSLKAIPSGGNEHYTFDWQPANKIEGSNTTQEINTATLSESISFTCTVRDTDNHSFEVTSPLIVVNPIPEANAYIEANGTTYKTYNILAGNQVLLSMNDIAGATYSWEPANLIRNFIQDNHRIARTIDLPENDNTEFTATVTTSSGCINEDNLIVIVHKALDESYISASSIEICENFEVTLTAHPDGGTGNFSYHWTPEEYYSDPYSQTTNVYPNVNYNSYSCTITDEGIDDRANNRITKEIDINILEKPSVNPELIGQYFVQPGVDYMPYIYEYNVQVSSLHGYDIENAEYEWEIASYYETPNHIAGTESTSSWQVYADAEDKNKAYVSIDEEGNAILTCKITTDCGSTVSQKFIYTDGYGQGASVNELDYDKMIALYPNPSNGELYIGYSELLTTESLTISIYSYNGMLIDQFKADASSNVTKYSMEGLANGLYLIKINGNDFVVTKKFVLNK
ncbi:MAG: T9SS type A sorting domain-containing protein [Bacteroidales bacterium]|nr:T9SS type A sorting domain-containing protein [Bacteroidales bacterium]